MNVEDIASWSSVVFGI